ncbi:MAG: hypothetical protein WEC75_10190 [Dehalococcoidia bacterium]
MTPKPSTRTLLVLACALAVASLVGGGAANLDSAPLRWVIQLAVTSVALLATWWAGATGHEAIVPLPPATAEKVASIRRDARLPSFDRDSGLAATWYFRLRIEEEMARAERYRQPFTLVTIAAETREGLGAVRGGIRDMLRASDLAGSLGDAVAVLMPNTARDGAKTAIPRINTLAEDLVCHAREYPTDGRTLSALLGEHEWLVDNADPIEDAS